MIIERNNEIEVLAHSFCAVVPTIANMVEISPDKFQVGYSTAEKKTKYLSFLDEVEKAIKILRADVAGVAR
jgi:hypothetical protein